MTKHEQDHFPLTRAELLAILAFWTLMALLSATNYMLDPRLGFLRPLRAAPVAVVFMQSAVWALLTPGIFWLAGRYTITRDQWFTRLLISLAVAMLVAAGVDALLNAFRDAVSGPPPQFRRPPPGPLIRFWFLDDLKIFLAVLAAGYARAYFYRYQNRQAEAVRLTAQLADARLSALRTQLNPHFLFNTLNAVSALVEKDPRGVRRMIARLSDLLRQTLDDSSGHEASLSDELRFVQHYLDIMQTRFPDGLAVDVSIDAAALPARVPRLVLQPLVENAIKHGGVEERGRARIDIAARLEGNKLILTVQDDGPGPYGSGAQGAGTGLRNTRERLQALYGDQQSVTLRTAPEGGTIAEVIMPYVARTDR